MNRYALDRYITGNDGDDQFRDYEPEPDYGPPPEGDPDQLEDTDGTTTHVRRTLAVAPGCCDGCNAPIATGEPVEVVSASGPDAPAFPLLLCRACWAESEGE